MSKEDRKEFAKGLQQLAATRTDDGIAEDWKKLVAGGTIDKIMKREAEYKKAGGYTELEASEDIEK